MTTKTAKWWLPLLLAGCARNYRVIDERSYGFDRFAKGTCFLMDEKRWESSRRERYGVGADVPRIDFENEAVLFVCAGRRPDTGYDLKVVGITREGDTVTCVIREDGVGWGCAVSYPSIFVAIRREVLLGAKHLSIVHEKTDRRELGRLDLP